MYKYILADLLGMIANNDPKDVAYVFSNPLPTQNPLGDRPGDAELAELMTSMWVSFINDLTPNNHQSKSGISSSKFYIKLLGSL